MKEVIVKDADLQKAAVEGMDAFLQVFTDAIHQAIGGELNADNMQELSAEQITLLAYVTLRDEVMDGGFVQLIHNGYGPFFFKNPFDRAMRNWGLATSINSSTSAIVIITYTTRKSRQTVRKKSLTLSTNAIPASMISMTHLWSMKKNLRRLSHTMSTSILTILHA